MTKYTVASRGLLRILPCYHCRCCSHPIVFSVRVHSSPVTIIVGFFLPHPPTILFHDLSDPYFAKSPETQQRLSHPIHLSFEIHSSTSDGHSRLFCRIVSCILFLDPERPVFGEGSRIPPAELSQPLRRLSIAV